MARYGSVMKQDLYLIIQTGIGFIQILAGHGFQTIAGVGLLSTMAVGFMMIFMDGYGYPDMSGLLPG